MSGSVVETRKKALDKICQSSCSQDDLVAKCVTEGTVFPFICVIFYLFLGLAHSIGMIVDKKS